MLVHGDVPRDLNGHVLPPSPPRLPDEPHPGLPPVGSSGRIICLGIAGKLLGYVW